MRRVLQHHPNRNVYRERNCESSVRLFVLLSCGVLLAGGFAYAARQHFTTVQYGYRSEELREQRTRLLEEQRRLLLAFEEAASPARLERAAREAGMQPIRPAQIGNSQRKDAQEESVLLLPPAPAFVSPPLVSQR